MCGIAGICGPVHETAVLQAQRMLAHRGPDDSGVFIDRDAEIALVHTRLSILDLSVNGRQPMSSRGGSLVVVFNGEIYNFRELRRELERQGTVFLSQSDTEVLVELYLRDGSSMLDRLNGIFAVAIWDYRSRSLLLARDGLGVKPLYYSETSDSVAFASEIKSLLHLVPSSQGLDTAALHRYMSYLWCPGNGTPLKAVRKLEPGQALSVSRGRISAKWAWYRLPALRCVRADLSRGDAIVQTQRQLRQAVHRQMVADVPVGAFLSGGLDSSAVVAFAREISPHLECFTIQTEDARAEGFADDLPYATRVAKHLNVKLTAVRVSARRMADDLVKMVVQLDEPLADPASLNVFYICALARQHGMKVLLSGAGGDDLFTGYRRHRALSAWKYLRWLPTSVRTALARASRGVDQRRAHPRRVTKLLDSLTADGDEFLVHLFRWSREEDLKRLYTPDFLSSLKADSHPDPMMEFLTSIPTSVEPLSRLLALEQRFFLADHNLIYTDKMSMAAGVEVRVPFLDTELVDFAQRVPTSLKQRGAQGKWILKKAMEAHLPREVIYRPKSGFGVPLRKWMRQELGDLIGDLLSGESLRRRGLFNEHAVNKLIEDNRNGKIDGAYTLLSLLCVEIWCREFLDSRPYAGQELLKYDSAGGDGSVMWPGKE